MERQESASVSGRESEPVALTGSHELDAFLGKAFDEKPIWSGLYESIRDMFFPPKLPPLDLTSTPIPVVDPMAVKANPWAIGIATGVNVAILALLLFLGVRQIVKTVTAPKLDMTKVDITEFKAPKMATAAGGAAEVRISSKAGGPRSSFTPGSSSMEYRPIQAASFAAWVGKHEPQPTAFNSPRTEGAPS